MPEKYFFGHVDFAEFDSSCSRAEICSRLYWKQMSTKFKKYKEMPMKFLSMYKSAERNAPPSQEEMNKMGKLIEEGMKAGWLVATEGCLPSALGARVRSTNGKVSVTDGPFTEAKEVVGGFAILRANSKEHAIQLAKDFLKVVGEGECELRQIYEADTCASAGH
jgi:hypothetical protein